MEHVTQNLTEGKLARQIFLFSVPLMISNLLQALFNMADIMVVGQFVGPEALGSVGSTTILVTLFTGFLIGMGNGVNVMVARYFGARSDRDVSETVHTSLILCLLEGVVILALGQLFSRAMLELLNTKEVLIDDAALYLRIYFLGMPAMAVYNFGNAVFSAVGNTKKPLLFLTTAGVANVVMNLFFVIVCGLGVAGVAIASAASQCVCAVLIIVSLLRSKENIALRPHALKVSPDKARFVLRLGIPAGCQNAIFAIANLFIQSGVNSFDAVTVEGNSAAANSDALVYDVMNAFYMACSSFISQNMGAKKKKRMLQSYFISLAYSFGAGAVLGLSLVVFGRQFLSLFTKDAAVMEAGMARLRVMGFSYMVSAFMDNTIAASRGLGKALVPTIIVILGSCVFRVVWVYTIFAYFHTIDSLYLLYVFSWTITAVAEILYFAKSYRNWRQRYKRSKKTPSVWMNDRRRFLLGRFIRNSRIGGTIRIWKWRCSGRCEHRYKAGRGYNWGEPG